MKGFKDKFEKLPIYRVAFSLGWLTAARDVWHGVPTCVLARMRDWAPSNVVSPVELMRSALMKKTYTTTYFINSPTTTAYLTPCV